MLPRRHIRIKVFQSLYAYSQQNLDKNFSIEKEYHKNLEGYLNSYFFIINLIKQLHNLALSEIKINKNKFIPSKADLNPNIRFINNFIFQKTKKTQIPPNINFDNEKLNIVIKKIFTSLKKTKFYNNYMLKTSIQKVEEKKIIFHILKKYFINNEKIHDFIEDYSIYWNEDMMVAYNIFKEKINHNQTLNSIKIFRKKEDQIFGKNLINKTIQEEKATSKIIHKIAKNWDEERIALTDLILIRMAMIEIRYFIDIPNNVTIDEYIEIAKQYSTPKSKEFINGILDVFSKDILSKKLTE
ncbi:MAG: transcription antitermination factor NusB [Flavobacteriales bacterium]|nr:transcription antitermination factor NusB [Flavobacteriales bacterium]|tara:strand:+ start:509 stop:1402 length:894 start_codon:yes stop_codon:yes gene_type:complete